LLNAQARELQEANINLKLNRNSLNEARSKFSEEKQKLEAKNKQQQDQLSKAFDDQRTLI
jgi:hypothetical protein